MKVICRTCKHCPAANDLDTDIENKEYTIKTKFVETKWFSNAGGYCLLINMAMCAVIECEGYEKREPIKNN